jgi:hypothetical protein
MHPRLSSSLVACPKILQGTRVVRQSPVTRPRFPEVALLQYELAPSLRKTPRNSFSLLMRVSTVIRLLTPSVNVLPPNTVSAAHSEYPCTLRVSSTPRALVRQKLTSLRVFMLIQARTVIASTPK